MTPRTGQVRKTLTPGRSNPFDVAGLEASLQVCANVLGVPVNALDMETALTHIEHALSVRRRGYICMAAVHGIMEAQRKPEVLKAYTESFMTLPDGRPTVWVGRLQGLQQMEQVSGPEVMLEVFRRRAFDPYTHFLYGGKPGVAQELADRLSRQFPWARIVGTYTPPFRELQLQEERQLITTLRRLNPSFVWVGISSPRQELFMHRYLPHFPTTLMLGVGAAFDYHTGRIRDSADWIKRAGLQWLHRLMQDPKHLLWRYLRTNPAFLWQIGLQLTGLRNYAIPGEFNLRDEGTNSR
ncbi:MAG TPA: WecB/TagA/CpsF family glycosyltransferase [Terracidiphilus sp.]|nr:WecB/TagA/CpsF family glycosyltransferase [Terracidiphilus sp.]